MVRCGSSPKGPYARPGSVRVLCGRCTVTVCPALTSSGNFCPPNCWITCAGVDVPPPIRTSGPTTRLPGSAKAPGKFASDRAEQPTWRPRGMLVPDAVGVAPAVRPPDSLRLGEVSDSQPDMSKTETAAAAAALAIAGPALILMHLRYAGPDHAGPARASLCDSLACKHQRYQLQLPGANVCGPPLRGQGDPRRPPEGVRERVRAPRRGRAPTCSAPASATTPHTA